MLFYVSWQPRANQSPADGEASLEMFTRWTPPEGLEFKGFFGRPDGGGFCICETPSAEVLFEATAPWAGGYLDYEIMPIVEMDKAVELQQKAFAFRKG